MNASVEEALVLVFVLPQLLVIEADAGVPASRVRPVLQIGGRCKRLTASGRRVTEIGGGRMLIEYDCDLAAIAQSGAARVQVWAERFLLFDEALGAAGTPVTGGLDHVEDYCLTGWVARLDGTAAPNVTLLVDGVAWGPPTPATARHRLARLAPPPSCAGFRLQLPPAALDGRTHSLSASAEGVILGTQTWRADPRFSVKMTDSGTVRLWILDRSMPDTPLTVTAHLASTGEEIARGRTGQHGETPSQFEHGQIGLSLHLPPRGDILLRAGAAGQLSFAALYEVSLSSGVAAARVAARAMLHAHRTGTDTGVWERDALSRLRQGARMSGTAARTRRAMAHGREVGVSLVIPIYKGALETQACLASIAASIAAGDVIDAIILVDDASPDPAMAHVLRAHAGTYLGVEVSILRNETNLGFVDSANRGIAAADPAHDVILLNADIIVPEGFAARLKAAVHTRPDIASATPLSNDATILSLPDRDGGNRLTADEMNALDKVLQARRSAPQEIPTGVGFCLYMRRDAIDDTGMLSRDWGRGYCEEVDWCLRARDRGWSHVAATDTAVFHKGSVSFGSAERQAILIKNHALLEKRFPEFIAEISAFLNVDPFLDLRIDAFCRLLADAGRPCLLHFTHAMGGGTKVLVEALATRFAESGGVNLICSRLHDAFLDDHIYHVEWVERKLILRLPDGAIESLLKRVAEIGLPRLAMVVHSLTGVGPAIRGIAPLIPYVVYIHDYQWFCPRVVLVDQTRQYCGEPGPRYCQLCVRSNTIYDFAGEETQIRTALPAWIDANAVLLRGARAVIAPSHDAGARITAHFGLANLHVMPHPEPQRTGRITRRADGDDEMRIAVVGGISVQKGADVLRDLGAAIDQQGATLRIEVIGEVEDPSVFDNIGSVHITGRYRPSDLPGLLARFDPHIVFFPAVWPETWSFALSEVWACGYAVAAFDIGAIAERIRATGAGIILPFETDPDKLLPRLVEAGKAAAALSGRVFEIAPAAVDDPVAMLFAIAAMPSLPVEDPVGTARATDGATAPPPHPPTPQRPTAPHSPSAPPAPPSHS